MGVPEAMARNSDNTTAATRRHIAHAIKQGYLDFDIALEVDGNGWRSYYPPWEDLGAATWGTTWSEAVNNIDEVLGMILDEIREGGINAEEIAQRGGLPITEPAASGGPNDLRRRVCFSATANR